MIMRLTDVLVGVLLTASAALLVLLGLAFSGHLVQVHDQRDSAPPLTDTVQPAAPAPARPAPAPARPAPPPAPEVAPESDPILDVSPPAAALLPRTTERPAAVPAAQPVVVKATTGDCWLQARAGSAKGRVLYEGTLVQGTSIRFRAKRVWLRLGAASHVLVTVGGKPHEIPTGTVDLLL
jgi:RodZ C-terminal domain